MSPEQHFDNFEVHGGRLDLTVMFWWRPARRGEGGRGNRRGERNRRGDRKRKPTVGEEPSGGKEREEAVTDAMEGITKEGV